MSFPHSIADGRYTLVEPLGVGGMATVFKAFDQRLQVWRAVKVLSPQYSNRPSLKDRFEAEARTTALLEHKHIVKVYDVGRSNGSPYIVMELVEGGTLVDWVKRHGPMPPRLAVDASIQTCEGVGAAHARKVVHRDVKPHNVLIAAEGVCRITDFGIARVGDDSDGLTRTGAVFGTWAYMAPEQRADAKKVDSRADVYSLGATLYFLLTGRTPVDLFAAEKDASVMEGIPEALLPVLLNATQYARNDRYESVHALIAGLQAALPLLPPDPPDTPPLARANSPLPKTWAPPERPQHHESANPPAGARFGETMVPDPDMDLGNAFADSDQPSSASSASVELPQPDEESVGPPPSSNPTRTQPDELQGSLPPLTITSERRRNSRAWMAAAVIVLLVGVIVGFNRRDTHNRELTQGEQLSSGAQGPSEALPGPNPANGAQGPGGANPDGSNPSGANPGGSNPDGSNPDGSNPPGVNPDGSSQDGAVTPGTPETSNPTVGPGVRPVEAPKRARVKVSGDATAVQLLSDDGVSAPGSVKPGTYEVQARFGDADWTPAGEITLRAGESATLNCTAAFLKCRKQ